MKQSEALDMAMRETLYGLSRNHYVKSLGFTPFAWQSGVLSSRHRRKHINGARQSGKSTIVSAVPCHSAKYYPNSLSIILAPTEKQATEDILKVKEFIASDPTYPDLKRDSQDELALDNGSRILVIPATEKSARGYSNPRVIVLDEASRIPDVVYKSGVRPMLTDNPDCEMFAISTPNGKQGFFYEASKSDRFERYEIRSPWTVDPGDSWSLLKYMEELIYQKMMIDRNIAAWFSPRHFNLQEQLENLEAMGMQQYQQEYCCEFVEQEDMVFSYEELDRVFGLDNRVPGFGDDLDFGVAPDLDVGGLFA